MSENPQQPFRVVPAGRGLAWLLTATRLIRQQTWRLLTVAVLIQLAMSFTQMPIIGLLIALGIPVLSAGMLQCFDHVRRGLPLSPVVVFAPLANRQLAMRLLLLGGLIALVAVLFITWMLSGIEELQDPELLARIEQGDLEAVLALDPAVVQRALLAVVIGVGVSGTLGYFTIPLVWFRQMPLWAAIVTGLKALVKNWSAFLLLGAILVILSIPLFITLGLLVGIAAVAGGPGILQYALVLLVVLIIQLLMFGTQYCAFAEIFELEGPGQTTEKRDDQLVA
jgi:hypothetical protein